MTSLASVLQYPLEKMIEKLLLKSDSWVLLPNSSYRSATNENVSISEKTEAAFKRSVELYAQGRSQDFFYWYAQFSRSLPPPHRRCTYLVWKNTACCFINITDFKGTIRVK